MRHTMKKLFIIIGLALVAIFGGYVALGTATAAARPLKLVIKGTEGQKFTGFYVADGITNSVSAVAPTTLDFEARNVNFEFRREGGVGEFRVELYVNDHSLSFRGFLSQHKPPAPQCNGPAAVRSSNEKMRKCKTF